MALPMEVPYDFGEYLAYESACVLSGNKYPAGSINSRELLPRSLE
jgi:hypothetical protein